MPARLRPTPMTISLTKSVRACGNATPFSTALGCVCSRASTSLKKASGSAIFLPLMSDASVSTISRIAFAGFRERNRRIACCSCSRSASAIGIVGGEIYWIMRQTQLSSKIASCGDSKYSSSTERGTDSFLAAEHLRPGLCQRDVAFLPGRTGADHGLAATAGYDDELGHHQQHRDYYNRVFHARRAAHHFLLQPGHRCCVALDRGAQIPFLRRLSRARPH